MELMRKFISPLLVVALIIMPVSELISFDNSEPEQVEDKPVVIHEKVGESIDLKERDYYKLFLIYENFQSAAVLLTDDGSFVLQIKEFKKGRQYMTSLPLAHPNLMKLREYLEQFETLSPDSMDNYFTSQEKLILGLTKQTKEEKKAVADQRKVREDLVLMKTKENNYKVTDGDIDKKPVISSEKRKWKFQMRTGEDKKRVKIMAKEKWEEVKGLTKEKWSRERWKEEQRHDSGTNYRTTGTLLGFTLGAAAGMLIGKAIQGEEIEQQHHSIPARGEWREGWDGPYYHEISPAKSWTDNFYSYRLKYAPHLGAGIGGVTGAVVGYYLGKKADKNYYILVPGSIRKEKITGSAAGAVAFACLVSGPALGALTGMTMVVNQSGREEHRRTFNWELGIVGYILGSFLGATAVSGFNSRKRHFRMWEESLLEEKHQSSLKLELLPTDPTAFSMRNQKLPCGSVFSEYRMNMMRLSF